MPGLSGTLEAGERPDALPQLPQKENQAGHAAYPQSWYLMEGRMFPLTLPPEYAPRTKAA